MISPPAAWRRAAWWLAPLLVAGAAAAAELPDSFPVRLVSPSAGDVLVAGTTASVEWEPLADLTARGVVEWEAFLSFNGGRYYAVRLTPHLDLARRRFDFEVPALATRDARLMLRFGDEVREVGFEMPERFHIAVPPVLGRAASLPAARPGERARAGDPGVVAWMEGSRDGSGLAWREASEPAPLWSSAWRAEGSWPLALLGTTREDAQGALAAPLPAGAAAPRAIARAVLRNAVRALDLLLLLHRRNE